MSGPVNTASILPDELWVKILSRLAPERVLELHTVSLKKLAQDQRNLYRVRSVCSRFNKLFLESPKLSSCLILEWRLRPVCTPGLLAWLRCHSCCVETVMTDCDTYALDMVLDALLTQPQRLKTLELGPSQESDLRMVACFSNLATLGFSPSDTNNVFDSSALQALPHLRTLSLFGGEYSIKELPEGLLSLRLKDANLELVELTTSVVPLQNLKVVGCRFFNNHSDGILAYTTLQELYLYSGSVYGSYTSDGKVVEFGRSPYYESYSCPDLSPLKFLSVLYMNASGHDEPIDWVCLYCLSSLQALTLHSTSQDLKIDQKLTMLSNLTSLKLIGASVPCRYNVVLVSVAINVSWGAMSSLQTIYVESDRLQFGPNMLELLQVLSLRCVTFLNSKHVTAEQPADFAALLQGLIVQRPGVTLMVNGSHKLAVHCKHTCA